MIESALYFLTGILIIVNQFLISRKLVFNSLLYFNLFYMLVYVIVPLYATHYDSLHYSGISEVTRSDYVVITVLCSYVIYMIAWQVMPMQIKGSHEETYREEKSQYNVTLGFMALYIIASTLYYNSFGGLLKAISTGALARYGYEEIEMGWTRFAKNIMPLGNIILYFTFYKVYFGPIKEVASKYKKIFYVSICLVSIASIITASRGAVVEVFIILTAIAICNGYQFKLKHTSCMLICACVFTVYGKGFFYAVATVFSKGDFLSALDAFNQLEELRTMRGDFMDRMVQEFIHPFGSLTVAMDLSLESFFEYGYFTDYLFSFLRIIPQTITSQWIELPPTVSYINTVNLSNNYVASIPPGLLGGLYYSGGYLGIFFGMVIYAAIGKYLFKLQCSQYKNSTAFVALFCFLYGGYVTNGDPNIYIYDLLWPTVFMLFIKLNSKRYTTIWQVT
jgi:hypothetical protein